MTASISALTPSSANYHCHDREVRYTLLEDMPSSFWFGQGAKVLELTGTVNELDFSQLLRGYNPEGQLPLVQNAGHRDRQCGTEITFSVPGTLAALFATSNNENKTRIANIIVESVKKTLGIIEDELSYGRRGSQGEHREATAGLVIACFLDVDNRLHQAMPHVHCCILNVALRHDGSYGTLVNKPFYVTQKLLGQIFHELLAQGLEQDLGLRLQQVGTHFEVVGVPSSVFPTLVGGRRKNILESIEPDETSNAKACERAARRTRTPKTRIPHQELFERWKDLGVVVGFTEQDAERLFHQQRQEASPREKAERAESIQQADATPRSSPEDFETEASQSSQAHTTDNAETEKLSSEEPDTEIPSSHNVPYSVVEQVLSRKEWQQLDHGQREAILILTSISGPQAILEASTGTGKDQVIAAASAIWKKAGYDVIGTALDTKSSQSLASNTGLDTKPVGRLLTELERTRVGSFCHHLRQIARAMMDKPTWSLQKTKLGSKSILVLEDAYLLSQSRLTKIMTECQMKETKLILVSDPVLRKALGKWANFHELVQNASVKAALYRNHRQKDASERLAMESLGFGNFKEAINQLFQAGRLVVSNKPMLSALMAWKTHGIRKPKEHVLIAESRTQANELNQQAQALRKSARQLGVPYLWVDPLNVWERSKDMGARFKRILHDQLGMRRFRPATHQKIHEGDRVVCTADYALKGIRAGMTGTVKRIKLGSYPQVTIRFDDGKKVKVYRDTYKQFQLAYAFAAEDLRGRTVEHAYVPLTLENQRLAYLQLSRGSASNNVFAPPEIKRTQTQTRQEPSRGRTPAP